MQIGELRIVDGISIVAFVSGAIQFYYVAPISGDYNVVVTDTNGCEVEAALFNVVARIETPIEINELKVYKSCYRRIES